MYSSDIPLQEVPHTDSSSVDYSNVNSSNAERNALQRANSEFCVTEQPTVNKKVGWSSLETVTRQTNRADIVTGREVGSWQHTLGLKRRKALFESSNNWDLVDSLSTLRNPQHEDTVDAISAAMNEDPALQSADVGGTVKRRDAVRALTIPLSQRKMVRANGVTAEKKLSCWQRFKYKVDMHIFKNTERLKAAGRDYSLWHSDIKVIEGLFGSGVGLYFYFLRRLLLWNTIVALLILLFLLVPELVYKASLTDTSPAVPFGGWDFFTGEGWFLQTELYYGGYSKDTSAIHYNMPVAYFVTVLVCLFLYLAVIAKRVVALYTNHTLSGRKDVGAVIASKVFTAWDFSITDQSAAYVQKNSIFNQLKVLLIEMTDKEAKRSWCDSCILQLKRGLCWTVVLVFVGLVTWGLFELLVWVSEQMLVTGTSSGWLLVVPAMVTVILLVMPPAFEWLVNFENYSSPNFEIAVTLCRTTILELVLLALLVYKATDNVTGVSQTENIQDTNCMCWESKLGAQLYRLTVLDLFIQLLSSLCIIVMNLCCSRFSVFEKFVEFSVSRHTLHLVYNQMLLWVGLFFAPLLAFISLIKLVILFYVIKVQVVFTQRPSQSPWRAKQSETVFYMLTLMSLVTALLAIGFVLLQKSGCCGPLADYSPYSDVVDKIGLVGWVTGRGVAALLIIILLTGAYWAYSIAVGREELVGVLYNKLQMEAKDRAFLVDIAKKMHKGASCLQADSDAGPRRKKVPNIRKASFTYSPGSHTTEDGDSSGEDAQPSDALL